MRLGLPAQVVLMKGSPKVTCLTVSFFLQGQKGAKGTAEPEGAPRGNPGTPGQPGLDGEAVSILPSLQTRQRYQRSTGLKTISKITRWDFLASNQV